MRKFILRSLTIMFCGLILGNQTWAFSASSATITLEKSVHFVTPDGSDVVIQPGTYTIEPAEEWLLVIPGERRDALLLEAIRTQHNEALKAAKAMSQSGEADDYRIVLLLPGGKGLEAIGSVSGVRSRAVKRRPSSRTRSQQQQASRIPTQSKNNTVSKKSKPIPKSPGQPNDPLAQRIHTLEQQVSSLRTLVNTLQSQLNRMASAIQVDNAGNVTISQSGKLTIHASTVKISAGSITTQAGMSKI